MAGEGRLLLVSRAREWATAVDAYAAERDLRVVRAADAEGAVAHLRQRRFACAVVDLDALGDAADGFLERVRALRPDLPVAGLARAAATDENRDGVPILGAPLSPAGLGAALAAPPPPPLVRPAARARRAAHPVRLEADPAALRQRLGQLTTLFQIARALGESRNWTEALDDFLSTLRDALGARGAGILLYSRENRVLAPRTVLSMAPHDVDAAVRMLLEAFPTAAPHAEVHALECFAAGDPQGLRCTGHAGRWHRTVLPLLYRRTPLGFLVLDKQYDGGADFAAESYFLETVQTILAEEVANAVHLSRLVDLKNLNEAVLDNVESGVLTANEAGLVVYLNRRGRQVLGLDLEAPLPRVGLEVLFPSPPPHGAARLRAAGLAPESFDDDLVRPDGSRVPVHVRARRIRNPSDSEPLLVVAFEDLGERRDLEAQARRADRLRSLGELSAAIAHEIRNPLQALSLTLANLEGRLQPGAETHVRVMFAEIDRLNTIVSGVLSFARPAPPQPVTTSLAAIAARAVALAAQTAAARDVEIQVDPGAPEGELDADPDQILQVLSNLLLNAVEASPRGGRVEASWAPEGDAAWRLAVRDRGPGIPAADREQVFDPFFTTKPEGNGLGLAVSLKIVEEHAGRIAVEDAEGGGTVFAVHLPRRFAGGRTRPIASPTQEGARARCT